MRPPYEAGLWEKKNVQEKFGIGLQEICPECNFCIPHGLQECGLSDCRDYASTIAVQEKEENIYSGDKWSCTNQRIVLWIASSMLGSSFTKGTSFQTSCIIKEGTRSSKFVSDAISNSSLMLQSISLQAKQKGRACDFYMSVIRCTA